MGTDIHGWVEVCPYPHEKNPDRDPFWTPAVHINNIVKRNYKIFGYFFGVQRGDHLAQFPQRDLPTNLTEKVTNDHENWGVDAHSETHCTFAEFYPAWCTYSNQKIDSEQLSTVHYHWQTLVDIMDQLATQYKSEYVRLVVWFTS